MPLRTAAQPMPWARALALACSTAKTQETGPRQRRASIIAAASVSCTTTGATAGAIIPSRVFSAKVGMRITPWEW